MSCVILLIAYIHNYLILYCSISTIIYKCSNVAYIYQIHLSRMDNLNSSSYQETIDARRIKTIPPKESLGTGTLHFLHFLHMETCKALRLFWKSDSCFLRCKFVGMEGKQQDQQDFTLPKTNSSRLQKRPPKQKA